MPASVSIDTEQPNDRNFLTVSGEAATRVSPEADSYGIKNLVKKANSEHTEVKLIQSFPELFCRNLGICSGLANTNKEISFL